MTVSVIEIPNIAVIQARTIYIFNGGSSQLLSEIMLVRNLYKEAAIVPSSRLITVSHVL